MGVLIAAISALLYGSADFMGGLASRSDRALAVTVWSQFVGLITILAVAVIVGASEVAGSDLGWGAVGGMCGGVGLLLFYGALAQGAMALVAPITAVCSAVVPVVFGVATGDRPSWLAVVGLVCAFPAIVLVARGTDDGSASRLSPRLVAQSLAAGSMFGLFFVAFSYPGDDAGFFPAVAARVASVTLLGLTTAITVARGVDRSEFAIAPGSRWMVIGTGVFDVSANAAFLVATRYGMLSLVSVVSAMYPATTVALARAALHERLVPAQIAGMVLAAAAVGLVAAS